MQAKVNSGTTTRSPVKRLKHLLIDRDRELQDLAVATGLSISLIKKIASGSKAPSRRAINRMEAACGCRLFSSPREYRARQQKKASAGVIEFSDAPSSHDDNNSTASSKAVHQEPTT